MKTAIHPEAFHAIRAAQNKTNWGSYAAMRYIQKRNVNPALYRLAQQLENARKIK